METYDDGVEELDEYDELDMDELDFLDEDDDASPVPASVQGARAIMYYEGASLIVLQWTALTTGALAPAEEEEGSTTTTTTTTLPEPPSQGVQLLNFAFTFGIYGAFLAMFFIATLIKRLRYNMLFLALGMQFAFVAYASWGIYLQFTNEMFAVQPMVVGFYISLIAAAIGTWVLLLRPTSLAAFKKAVMEVRRGTKLDVRDLNV